MTTPPDRSLRAFLVLAWPIVLSRATQAVINFSDTTMVAPLGEDAFAAATAGSINAMNVIVLPMGVVFLIQSFAAQLHGKGIAKAARRYALYGLIFAVVVEVLTLALLGTVGPGVELLSYSPPVRAAMTDYLTWRLAGIGFVVASEALGNYRGGLGDTRTPMFANAVAMLTNIGLNVVFIYGYFGVPAMGVKGAAIASSLASFCGMMVLVVVFMRENVTRSERGALRRQEFFRLLRFGLPNGLNWFLEFAAFTFFINVIVAKLGTAPVGALMAVLQVNSLAFMPAFGCASAGAILVGQAIGSNVKDWVPAFVKRTAMVTAAWQVLVGLTYALFPGQVMAIFGASKDASEDVVKIGAAILPLSAAWQLFDAMGMTLSEALRAAGDTAWTLWARIVVAWALFVPASWFWVGQAQDGAATAILCVVGYLAILSMLFLLRFLNGAWRRIDLTGEPSVDGAM